MKTRPASQLPSITAAKEQAKRLRERLEAEGASLSHSKSLELIAHQLGHRDWNTLHAAIGDRPAVQWTVGDRVRGSYLSQPFEAEILAVETVRPGWFRLTLDFDEAVDVVTFDSFSNFRKRVTGVVGPAGTSREKTSNGRPQLELDMRD
ncbi:glyoxalase superfamily protein [Schlegelella sp. S2-27]|uniref:Glyoxalase superfamily protein n=1 Tax=Caldimonas mangrovi TaxID=2944811 RepID=A0ABT0YRL8_9BURK|nr:glyoxalase superfamily protein [Caldimonas mangrovi]MCM5681386.1 glyoxalase superfamily protein [Caldimonas mangrovi]